MHVYLLDCCENHATFSICNFQILSIEQELFTLMRLHHRNLIHYLAIKYQEEAGKITVYVSNFLV